MQIIKDTQVNGVVTTQAGVTGHVAPKFSSAIFDASTGILFTGCQALKVWHAVVDGKVKIKALQVETLSKALLKERAIEPNYENQEKRQENRSGVLVSMTSELVEILLTDANAGMEKYSFLITIDSENLLRQWSVKTGLTTTSYKINMEKRITAAAIDESGKQFLAVGNTGGEVQVLNMKSGGVLYNLPSCDSEVTSLKFLFGSKQPIFNNL
jgi:hypothetical protein